MNNFASGNRLQIDLNNTMRQLSVFLSLMTFIAACKTKYPEKKEIDETMLANRKEEVNKKFSIADSLNKYMDTDSLYNISGHAFFAGKLNEQGIGLVQLSDTSTAVYHKTNEKWLTTDTLHHPIIAVQPLDLNGDDFKDLVITYSVSAAGSNAENIVFLFDPVSWHFRHNQYYDLPNIFYDKTKNKVFSSWRSSAVHSQEKQSYKITGASLVFEEGVLYTPDAVTLGDIGTVEFYYMRGNKIIITKKIKGKADKTWNIFAKALWDISND